MYYHMLVHCIPGWQWRDRDIYHIDVYCQWFLMSRCLCNHNTYIPATSMWSFFLPLLLKAEISVVLVEISRSQAKLPLPSKKRCHQNWHIMSYFDSLGIQWMKTLPGQRSSITVSLWVMDIVGYHYLRLSSTNQMGNKYQPLRGSQLHSP